MSRFRALSSGTVRRPWALLCLLGVALLTFAVGVAALGLRMSTMTTSDDLASVRKEATAAGRADAKVILSYDYRTLDKDFRVGRRATTGDFRAEYQKTTSKLVKGSAKKYHTVVTATVVASSVVSASREKVKLLLYVDQNTVSDLKKNGRLDQNRVLMTVVDVNGQWLVSDLESL